MSESIGQAAVKENLWRRFGLRNWGYLASVALLVPFGTTLFFIINLILLIVAAVKNRPAGKPAIAYALPVAIILGMMLLEQLKVS